MNAEPVDRELDDDEYEQFLNELYGTVNVCGMTMDAGHVLRHMDNIAFNTGKNDYENSLETEEWECNNCNETYNDEDDAEYCCQSSEDEE